MGQTKGDRMTYLDNIINYAIKETERLLKVEVEEHTTLGACIFIAHCAFADIHIRCNYECSDIQEMGAERFARTIVTDIAHEYSKMLYRI